MKALLLAHEHSLAEGGGGQQLCTREYRGGLIAAGFDVSDVTFNTDRRMLTRLQRKYQPQPYAHLMPDSHAVHG